MDVFPTKDYLLSSYIMIPRRLSLSFVAAEKLIHSSQSVPLLDQK
jgi:hypothetical protein